MNQQPSKGINRQGLDAAFRVEEVRKSNLILTAQLLRAQQKQDDAAASFAQAKDQRRGFNPCTISHKDL